MLIQRVGLSLSVVSEASDAWQGEVRAFKLSEHEKEGVILECRGKVTFNKKKLTGLSFRLSDKPELKAAVDQWIADCEADAKAKVEVAKNLTVIGFEFTAGCDSADTYRFEYAEKYDWNTHYDLVRSGEIEDLESMVRSLGWKQLADFRDAHPHESLPATGMSYGGWRVDAATANKLIEIARQAKAEKQAKVEAARAEKQAKDAAQTHEIMSKVKAVRVGSVKLKSDFDYDANREDIEPSCVIEVDGLDGATRKYHARNIFDFGLVVNPKGGGLCHKVHDDAHDAMNAECDCNACSHPTGWVLSVYEGDSRDMTQPEIDCFRAACHAVPDRLRGIRM